MHNFKDVDWNALREVVAERKRERGAWRAAPSRAVASPSTPASPRAMRAGSPDEGASGDRLARS